MSAPGDFRRAPSAPQALAVQARIETALAGKSVAIWGSSSEPSDYLADLQSLGSLLLHLAEQPRADATRPWVGIVRDAARARPVASPPRWYISAPEPSSLRATVLGECDAILSASELRAAAELFTPWYDCAPATNDSVPRWMGDRTRMTPQLNRLILAVHAPRQRISVRVTAGDHLYLFTPSPKPCQQTCTESMSPLSWGAVKRPADASSPWPSRAGTTTSIPGNKPRRP